VRRWRATRPDHPPQGRSTALGNRHGARSTGWPSNTIARGAPVGTERHDERNRAASTERGIMLDGIILNGIIRQLFRRLAEWAQPLAGGSGGYTGGAAYLRPRRILDRAGGRRGARSPTRPHGVVWSLAGRATERPWRSGPRHNRVPRRRGIGRCGPPPSSPVAYPGVTPVSPPRTLGRSAISRRVRSESTRRMGDLQSPGRAELHAVRPPRTTLPQGGADPCARRLGGTEVRPQSGGSAGYEGSSLSPCAPSAPSCAIGSSTAR
jgi:hypothetical protein